VIANDSSRLRYEMKKRDRTREERKKERKEERKKGVKRKE